MQYSLVFLIIFSALGFSSHASNDFSDLDLSRHLWKDRVFLVITEDDQSDHYIQQFNVFLNNKKGMSERKLVHYTITPSNYKYLNNEAIESDEPWNTFRKSTAPFSVQLIGLDGGVKIRRDAVLLAEDLFAIIDGMPMRQSELRRKKNK